MGDVFLLAVAAAFYPTLLAIVILILSRPRPVRLLAAYLAGGMIVSVAAGCVIVFALEGASTATRREMSPYVDLAAGALSLGVAALLHTRSDPRPRRLRRRREAASKRDPWTARAVSHDSVGLAFVLGLVLDLPSIWYLAALKDIAKGDYGTGVDLVLIFGFNLIMFTLVEVPLAAYLIAPERTTAGVTSFNAWLRAHARHIGEAIAGAVGIYLVVRGLVDLL